MTYGEVPAQTDAERILTGLDAQDQVLRALMYRLDGQAKAINDMGENMQWLVQNVQGIFAMFSSPQFMAQMGKIISGGMTNAGQPAAADNGR